MSINAKIIKDLGNNEYVIKVDPDETNSTVAGVCHDYALFSSYGHISTETGVTIKKPNAGASNVVRVKVFTQIPIRRMGEIVLPMLMNNKYLKEDHYKNYMVWDEETTVRTWDDNENIHVYDKTEKKYAKISKSLYEQLKSK